VGAWAAVEAAARADAAAVATVGLSNGTTIISQREMASEGAAAAPSAEKFEFVDTDGAGEYIDDDECRSDFDPFSETVAAQAPKSAPPVKFVSIDPGIVNVGMVAGHVAVTPVHPTTDPRHHEMTITITHRSTTSLLQGNAPAEAEGDGGNTALSTEALARLVNSWVYRNVVDAIGIANVGKRMVLIEGQYFNPHSKAAYQSHRLKTIEAMLYARFEFASAYEGHLPQIVSPKRVKKELGTARGSNAANKKAALDFCKGTLGVHQALTSHEADAILQVYVFMRDFYNELEVVPVVVVKSRVVMQTAGK
jgi:hypothetical protein